MSGQSDRFQVLRKLPKIRFDEELRGYSRTQVDRVLHSLAPLADEVDQLQQRLTDAETRAASAEARLATQPAAEAPAAVAEVPPPTPADFDETLRNTLLLAQRTADQTVKDANAEAERVVEAARAEAASLAEAGRRESDEIRRSNEAARAELDKDLERERTRRLDEIAGSSSDRLAAIEAELSESHEAQRRQLIDDIGELEGRRSSLTGEIERFEAHLAARREAVRSAIAELEAVADGDAGLQGEMPPEPADIPATDPASFAPVEVASPSLGALQGELGAAAPADAEPADDSTAFDDTAFDDTVAGEVADGDSYRPDEVVEVEADTDEQHGAAGESSGIMLGELDRGPDPDPIGPATEAVDVLSFDDDETDDEPAAAEVTDEHEVVVVDDLPAADGASPDDPSANDTAPDELAPDTADEIVLPADEVPDGALPFAGAPDLDGGPATEAADAVAGVVTDTGLPRRGEAPGIERPQWADDVPSADEVPTPPSDPFLEELRRVTTEDDTDDDALARFLESDPEDESDKGGGWFGRRR